MRPTSIFPALFSALVAGAAGTASAEGGSISGKVDATPAKYLGDTVVYLKSVPGTYKPHTLSMDQRSMKFIPHILVVTQGDTVKFLNNDNVAHNVYSPDGEGYNLGTFKPHVDASYTFTHAGAYAQLCSVHPEMLAYVFVSQNPYGATVDPKGHYAIKNVPPGTYQLAVWNASKLKAPEASVTVAAGKGAQHDFSIKR